MPAAFRRVIVKVSGQALSGEDDRPVSHEAAARLAAELKAAVDAGAQVGCVVGGGNIVRGVEAERAGADRVTADLMGMAATVVNGLALKNALETLGQAAAVMSAVEMGQIAPRVQRGEADRLLSEGVVPGSIGDILHEIFQDVGLPLLGEGE